jgi:purine-nucleoside phosphorylase
VVDALKKACDRLKVSYKVGPVWTTDALLRETREVVESFRSKGAVAVDMVTSSLLTIAQLKKVAAGSILAVSDNVITGEMGFINPKYYDAESNIVKVSLEAVKILEGK